MSKCTRLAQTGCTARKLALFIISQDRQTQVLAAIAMATTIIIDQNSWFPWSLSPAKFSTASACNNPSDNITEICYFWTVRLLQPKQNKVLYVNMEYMDLLPPASFSRAKFARLMTSSKVACTSMCHTDHWWRYTKSTRQLRCSVQVMFIETTVSNYHTFQTLLRSATGV